MFVSVRQRSFHFHESAAPDVACAACVRFAKMCSDPEHARSATYPTRIHYI